MSDIFISYAREDREKAAALAALLEQQGWSVWWDRNIPAGASFDVVIETQLAEAKCVIVIWSKDSVASHWVKGEAGEGAAREVLVPVRVDAAKIPLEFRRLQTVDLADWDGGAAHPELGHLLEAVSAHLKAPIRQRPAEVRPRRRLTPLLVAAAIFAVITFAIFAFRPGQPTPPIQRDQPNQNAPKAELTRTQNLGLEFWQDGAERPILYANRNENIVRVPMKQGPFEMRGPKTDRAMQICAWTDDSTFQQIANARRVRDVPFFAPGHAMAEGAFGSGELMLTNRANHYIDGDRRRPISDRQEAVLFSSAADKETDATLERWPTVYLVCFVDVNRDSEVTRDEFERVILEFEK